MEQYVIKGGNPLVGEVEISGAKNAALAILSTPFKRSCSGKGSTVGRNLFGTGPGRIFAGPAGGVRHCRGDRFKSGALPYFPEARGTP